jgi:hypothetical protein
MLPIRDIVDDTVKFTVMFIIQKWIMGGSVTDKAWQMSSLFTVLGFATYQISTRNFMDTGTGTSKLIWDDWIKVGTMLIVSQLLAGGSLTNSKWMYASLATLFGFTIYDVVSIRYVDGAKLTYSQPLQRVINDWTKFGTMLLMVQLLSCESFFDPKWIISSLGMLVGFSVYDLTLSQMISQIPQAAA